MEIKVLQLHKRASYIFKHIQDKYAINPDKKTFALADGTTQSFNSEIWAEIITKRFITDPKLTANELIISFKNSVVEFKNANFEFSSNPAKASLEKAKINKGGTATFFGLHFTIDNKIKFISCGDTNLFLLNSENKVTAFPFSDLDSLDANNYFINTEQLIANKIYETFFKIQSIEYKPDDKIIIATDALSRLILKKPSTLSELLNIEDFNQLNDFCLKYWESKELQEDDISAIIIPAKNCGTIKKIKPPIEFTFPKEAEQEFIPTPLQQKKQRNYSDMELNEIKNQFNGVAEDFHLVKKKLNLHEMLLMVAISLLMINIFLIIFFRLQNSKNDIPITTDKPANVIIEKYENIIGDLKLEIQTLKSKVSDISRPQKDPQKDPKKDPQKDPKKDPTENHKKDPQKEKVKPIGAIQKIANEEAKKPRRVKLADYKYTADGIGSAQSKKF